MVVAREETGQTDTHTDWSQEMAFMQKRAFRRRHSFTDEELIDWKS